MIPMKSAPGQSEKEVSRFAKNLLANTLWFSAIFQKYSKKGTASVCDAIPFIFYSTENKAATVKCLPLSAGDCDHVTDMPGKGWYTPDTHYI